MGAASINSDFQFRIKPFRLVQSATHCGGVGGAKGGSFKGTLMSPNAAADFQLSDDHHIEMITFEASPYTSLKDLLETSSPPPPPPPSASPSSWLIMSPSHLKNSSIGNVSGSGCRKDSWREIPIKDPLLQHAAWAYLLPMSSGNAEGGAHSRSVLQKLKNFICGGGGIFGCLSDVVTVMTKNWVSVFSR